MLVEDFIAHLRATATGAPTHVVVRDADGNYWDPKLTPSRVNVTGGEPYHWDDDRPFVYVIGLGND